MKNLHRFLPHSICGLCTVLFLALCASAERAYSQPPLPWEGEFDCGYSCNDIDYCKNCITPCTGCNPCDGVCGNTIPCNPTMIHIRNLYANEEIEKIVVECDEECEENQWRFCGGVKNQCSGGTTTATWGAYRIGTSIPLTPNTCYGDPVGVEFRPANVSDNLLSGNHFTFTISGCCKLKISLYYVGHTTPIVLTTHGKGCGC